MSMWGVTKKALIGLVFGSARVVFGGPIDDLEAEYSSRGLKVSTGTGNNPRITNTEHAKYFGVDEINSTNGRDYYYYDEELWEGDMDAMRDKFGPIVISGPYRDPDQNAKTKGADPESLHMYNKGTDAANINKKGWAQEMTVKEKDTFADYARDVRKMQVKTYTGHVHLENGTYCDIDT